MRYSFVFAALLAVASSVVGEIFPDVSSPTVDQVIPAGVSFDIIWVPAGVDGTISITLLQGATNTSLATGPVIATGVKILDGKFSWVAVDGGFATYGFFFQDEQKKDLTQYSNPFHIKGSKGASETSATGSTTTIHLSTGPSYTAVATSTSTTSAPSSTVTVLSTSTSANVSSSTIIVPSSSSNLTLLTSTSTRGVGPSPTTSNPSATSSITTPNAAVANIATGGLAMVGGLLIALAL